MGYRCSGRLIFDEVSEEYPGIEKEWICFEDLLFFGKKKLTPLRSENSYKLVSQDKVFLLTTTDNSNFIINFICI